MATSRWFLSRGISGLIALSAALAPPAASPAAVELELVSRPGPWSGVSQLIGYRGRLWFANSVKFRNHNSADLYSYDPNTRTTRYETHLFSQDAGTPVTDYGLLYWPFEDARFSMGRGELMVTNGEDWRWITMTEGEVFHVHALAEHGDALYAATSAWRAGLQRSTDRGQTWELIHEHATPMGQVSRFTRLAVLKNRLYAGLAGPSRHEPKLFELPDPGSVRPLAAWPPGRRSSILAVHAGWLYAVNDNDTGFGAYRKRLDAVLSRLTAAGDPETGAELSRRLSRARESLTLSVFGGAYEVDLARANDWYLLRAIALNGHGNIPRGLLSAPWDEARNNADKYFHPAPAAAWAVARTGQNDDETIGALIAGLERHEPPWLGGDWAGALTALTGERFGYDPPAWRQWRRAYRGMVPISAGSFLMGSDSGPEAETPAHEVFLPRFYIDRHETSNNEFARFVRATGHVTDAEQSGTGWHWDGEWHRVAGADWRHPQGPDSSIRGIGDHPVVQVSWRDARAYCGWRDKRLPTEAEWERAARGAGLRTFAWGDEPVASGGLTRVSYGTEPCCGISDADGFLYTAPVGSFPHGRSPRGIHDLTGNVWEWVLDSFDKDFYQHSPGVAPRNLSKGKPKVIRGGGWGNNPWGLRATLRHANPPDYALSMVGIRCAKDPPS